MTEILKELKKTGTKTELKSSLVKLKSEFRYTKKFPEED